MKFEFLADAVETPPERPAHPSVGYPSDGDARTGRAPTTLGAWFFYMLMVEFTTLLEQNGIEPDAENLHQLADFLLSTKRSLRVLKVVLKNLKSRQRRQQLKQLPKLPKLQTVLPEQAQVPVKLLTARLKLMLQKMLQRYLKRMLRTLKQQRLRPPLPLKFLLIPPLKSLLMLQIAPLPLKMQR